MSSLIYNSCLADAMSGLIDFEADDFDVILVTSSYVPDKDAHTKRSDVTNEVAGIGYATGGVPAAVSVSNDTATDRIDISLGTASWTASTITARGAVYFKSRGGAAAADELVAYIDFAGNVTSTNGTFSLTASTIRIQN